MRIEHLYFLQSFFSLFSPPFFPPFSFSPLLLLTGSHPDHFETACYVTLQQCRALVLRHHCIVAIATTPEVAPKSCFIVLGEANIGSVDEGEKDYQGLLRAYCVTCHPPDPTTPPSVHISLCSCTWTRNSRHANSSPKTKKVWWNAHTRVRVRVRVTCKLTSNIPWHVACNSLFSAADSFVHKCNHCLPVQTLIVLSRALLSSSPPFLPPLGL